MTIDELLARARQRLDRVTVEDALGAVRDGAVLVDVRSELHRARDGLIPGAIQSSLAAATLQDLGFARATDLAGGFQAWVAAGCRSSTTARG